MKSDEWQVLCPRCENVYTVPIQKARSWLCPCSLEPSLSLHPEAQNMNSEIYDSERQPKPTMCRPLRAWALDQALNRLIRASRRAVGQT